jgi:hypothetical protein
MYWWRERNGFINRPFYWCAVIGGPRDGVRRVNNVSDCQTALMQQSTAAYGPNENITTEVLAKAKHAEEHRKLSCYSQSGKDRAWIDRCISLLGSTCVEILAQRTKLIMKSSNMFCGGLVTVPLKFPLVYR